MSVFYRARLFVWSLCTLLLAISTANAQPAGPPLPEKYEATVRYRITSARDLHVKQYDALIEDLKALAFEFQPPLKLHPRTDREDPTKDTLQGVIPAANARKVFNNPNVVSLLLIPAGFKLPEDPKDFVRIRIELAGGLQRERQRALADQTRVLLRDLGFQEAAGYDHGGSSGHPFTVLAGAIPAGRLDALLKDLRRHPGGWFGPSIPLEELPEPLRKFSPIRVTEVLADKEPFAGLSLPEPRPAEHFEKISPELWALANDSKKASEVVRFEIIVAGQPAANDAGIKALLRERAPGIFIENQLGPNFIIEAPPGIAKALAELPEISALRLVRSSHVDVDPGIKVPGDNEKALALSGLAAFHKKGFRGQNVSLAILDRDFRGWQKLVEQKRLPPKTRLVDLTPERNPELTPEPTPDNGAALGHGTQCALAVALAAPDAELVLIRVPDASAAELAEIVRYIRGGAYSATLERRREDLATARTLFDSQRRAILSERREILDNFTDDLDLMRDFEFLGPVRGWIFSNREWSLQRLAHLRKLETELAARNNRFVQLLDAIQSLKGIPVVVNTMIWNEGYPLGGTSALSKLLDESPNPIWIQAAGNTRGQAWSGPFRDEHGDGILEFAASDTGKKKGPWTTELNFLGWHPYGKEATAELPEGARIRVTMQWREPHDPEYYLRPGAEDLYRKPLAALRLILLRQRDPEGKTVGADAFDLAAVSTGYPERLEHLPGSSVYEVSTEFIVPKAGRYALRIQRAPTAYWVLVNDTERGRPAFVRVQTQTATGIRPAGVATLPALERNWELNLRVFVDVLDEHRRQGRPIFTDYATDQGTTGLPADARNVISVGAADFDGKTRSYSATGALPYAELSRRPTVLAFDGLQLGNGGAYGTSVSASFAAGTIASLLSSGMDRENLAKLLQQTSGGVLKVSPSAK